MESSFVADLSVYEQQLQCLTSRAIAYMDSIISEDFLKRKITKISKSYPFINWKVVDNKIFSGFEPKITVEELEECDKTEFVSNCLSKFFPKDFISFTLIKMKNTNKGCLLVVASHAICSATLLGDLVSDIVSSKTDFDEETRPCLNDLLKNIPCKQQELAVEDPFIIPMNEEAPEGNLHYLAIAKSFDAEKIINTCKSIGVKPQSFLSACECYTLAKIFGKTDFSTICQVSVNTKKAFGVSNISPIIFVSLVNTVMNVKKGMKISEIMKTNQESLSYLIENFQKSHFKLITDGKLPIPNSTVNASNVGIIKSENADIWVHGGIFDIPDAFRMIKGHITHACTTNNNFNVVFTYVVPGCNEEFVKSFTDTMTKLLENPELALNTEF